MILSYYVQPFTLVLRKELLAPSFKRLMKVSFLSVFIELFLYIFFASACYASFGDKYTAELIILRVPYDGKSTFSEFLIKIVILLFFLITNIGLCVYNPGMRQYL